MTGRQSPDARDEYHRQCEDEDDEDVGEIEGLV